MNEVPDRNELGTAQAERQLDALQQQIAQARSELQRL